MKKKILAITAGLLTAMALTACGKDPKLTQFKGEIDAFCTEISDIDTAINNVDAESDTATDELLGYLESYHEAYSNGGYNQLTADYAKENYARAYKRIQIIITFLHGEQPENVNLTTAEETADAASTTAE